MDVTSAVMAENVVVPSGLVKLGTTQYPVRLNSSPDAIEARLAVRELGEWLGELPAPQRVALVLKEVEQLTAPEIAPLLGISEGAVEQLLVRGRATLRKRRQNGI